MEAWFAFRISFGILFLTFLVIWIYRFFLTGMTRSSFYSVNEGIIPGLSFRLTLTASVLAITAYLYDPELMSWSEISLPSMLKFAGILFGVGGLLLFSWTIKSLKDNFFATLKLKKGHKLITTGPYRWSRHPMYVAFMIMWICFFLLSENWFIGITGLITYAIIFIWRVPREEKMLRDHFGEDYIRYKERTGIV